MTEYENKRQDDLMEQLIASGPDAMGRVFARLLEQAMQFERERFLGAQLYERSAERSGYANSYKPKRLDTVAGSLNVQVPKTAGHKGEPFYPQSLERGRRSTRAVMLAVATMYIQGVSTRDAEKVMAEFGLVSDCAVLSAVGIGPDERRCVLGVSVARSEAEVHWRGLLEDLQRRGMRGVTYVVSDDHAGLKAARRSVLGGANWQRCQFHLAQNAIHHARAGRLARAQRARGLDSLHLAGTS